MLPRASVTSQSIHGHPPPSQTSPPPPPPSTPYHPNLGCLPCTHPPSPPLIQSTSHTLLTTHVIKSYNTPQFQRDFTWKGRDIRLLVDSMSRSYPIGSLLLLAKGPALPLADNLVDAEIPQNQISERSHSDEKYYILDGQQRITSIICVFLNADKKSYYSFDLEEMLDSKAYDKHQDSWIEITSRKHAIKIRNQEAQGQYLNPDIVLDQKESHREISKYIRNRKDLDEDKKIDAEGKILGTLEAIRKYTVPVVIIN